MANKQKTRKFYSSILLLFIAVCPGVYAIKPCLPNPCFNEYPNSGFNETKCRKLADWIAVGRISRVERDWFGMPLYKDFASFRFSITRWEKGKMQGVKHMNFKVKNCLKSVPTHYWGKFRFYGKKAFYPKQNPQNINHWDYYHFTRP